MEKPKINESDLESMSLPLLFVRILMCSYLYYIANEKTPWTDNQFDWACKKLFDNYDKFEHQNKNLLSKDSLGAGTGFSIKFTKRIICAS